MFLFHPSSFEDKLPPFKRLSHKEMQEMSVKNLPGLWFDMVENHHVRSQKRTIHVHVLWEWMPRFRFDVLQTRWDLNSLLCLLIAWIFWECFPLSNFRGLCLSAVCFQKPPFTRVLRMIRCLLYRYVSAHDRVSKQIYEKLQILRVRHPKLSCMESLEH